MIEKSNAPIRGIEAVVFDLGGVVIDLRRDNAVAALQRLGLADADALLDQYCQRGPFLALETGRITAAEFYDHIRTLIAEAGRPAPSDAEMERAFCDFLVGLPVERLQALRRLRKAGLRVFALSNTNPIMYPSWICSHFKQEGLTINDYFEGVVTSFMEGICKPDPEIFRRLIARYGLDPARTLFLDDSEANCLATEKTGLQTAHVGDTPDTDMIAITRRLI